MTTQSISEPQTNFWLEPRTIVAYAVSLLALAEIVDLTIVSVAIPNIMGSLNANLSEVSLTMTSYIVAAAVCIPLTGLVTRKFGMKNVVLVSALIFGISSVLCGMSTSLNEMIMFRLMQGVGGAFLPSIAQSYISKNFTQQEQPKIMTFYSLCVVLGPIIGPIFGGVLSENLNWRWCFYVNVPICIAGFILILMYMKQEVLDKVNIDYISFVFMALGVGCLEYFIDEGNTNNWFDSMQMIIVLVIAIILIGFFIWRGVLGKSVVNFKIFKNFNFVLCCVTLFLYMLLASGTLTYFPTLLQQGYGYPVDTAGIISAPRGMAAFVTAIFVAKLMGKIDPRKIMCFGILSFAAGCYMLSSYGPAVSESYIIISLIIQGVGMMSFFVPLMQIVFIDIPHEMNGDVSGLFNFFRNFSTSIGTSVASTIVSHQMQVTYHDMGAHISPYDRGFQVWSQHLGAASEQSKVMIAQLQVMSQGALVSYLDSFYIFALGIVFICWLPFFMKRPKLGAPVHLD